MSQYMNHSIVVPVEQLFDGDFSLVCCITDKPNHIALRALNISN